MERGEDAVLRMSGSGRSPRSATGSTTATVHYFGWYAFNVLELPDHVIAPHFGHRDGGELVRKLYGHPDAGSAREKVREACRQAPTPPVPLVTATAL